MEHAHDPSAKQDNPPTESSSRFESAMAQVVTAYELQHPRFLEAVGVSAGQLEALFLLRSTGRGTPVKLARELRLTSSSVTYLLDQLEKRNFIVRAKHARDRRSIIVSITDDGQEVTDRFIELVATAWRPAAEDSRRTFDAATEIFSSRAGHLGDRSPCVT